MDKKILTRVFVIAALFVGLTVNSAFAYRAEATIDNQCGDDIVAVYVYGSGADSSLRDVIPVFKSYDSFLSHVGGLCSSSSRFQKWIRRQLR